MRSFHGWLREETVKQTIERLMREGDAVGATSYALEKLMSGDLKYSSIDTIFGMYSAYYRNVPVIKKEMKNHSKLLGTYRTSGIMSLTQKQVIEVFKDMHDFFKKNPNYYDKNMMGERQ